MNFEQRSNEDPFRYEKGQEEFLVDRALNISEKVFTGIGTIRIPKDAEWNLDGESQLGISTMYNSPLSAKQLVFALAMSKHPAIDALLQDEKVNPQNFDINSLVDSKVLSGLKILDAGCGLIPLFARLTRALGADTCTVDTEPADHFSVSKENKNSPFSVIEKEKHLQLDLEADDVVEKLNALTGGAFGLVTEAHLRSSGGSFSEEKIMEVLKTGGIYFDGLHMDAREVKIKE